MKKILSIILAMIVAVSLVACKKNSNEDTLVKDEAGVNDSVLENETQNDSKTEADKQEDGKTEVNQDNKKPENPEQKPEEKPQQKPEQKPEDKPTQAPEVTEKTLGNTLLADFKAKANAGMSAEEIANGLLTNPAILFSGVTNPVAPGDYLPGFNDAEIKGFKSGVAFMPMIGSIPFVGYVFELDGSVGASSFISSLKSNANLRWLVCAEAEEMVAGSANDKVFFVMCPKSLEQ